MFVHTCAVRASISDRVVIFLLLMLSQASVLSPAGRMMITLSKSGAGAAAPVYGVLDVSACQAQTSPMVTLVMPFGFMSSTLLLSFVQSNVRGCAFAISPQS